MILIIHSDNIRFWLEADLVKIFRIQLVFVPPLSDPLICKFLLPIVARFEEGANGFCAKVSDILDL